MKCVLCGADIEPHRDEDGNIYWEGGHNAEPLAEGSCCDSCHPKVLECRIEMIELKRLLQLEKLYEEKRKKDDPSYEGKWAGWDDDCEY